MEPFDLLWIGLPDLGIRLAQVSLSKAHRSVLELCQCQVGDWFDLGDLGITGLNFGQAMARAAHGGRMQLARMSDRTELEERKGFHSVLLRDSYH